MNSDINTRQEVAPAVFSTVKALLEGHIIVVGDEEYRYATKGQELYEEINDVEDDRVFVATESGIYKRYFTSNMGSDTSTNMDSVNVHLRPLWANGFMWVHICSDSLSIISSLVKEMTEKEKLIISGNVVLTDINCRSRKLASNRNAQG